jgi:ribosomal-protein-alanine N-acetyltransferase
MPRTSRKKQHFVRHMIRADLSHCLDIESLCEQPEPWNEQDFLHLLKKQNGFGAVVDFSKPASPTNDSRRLGFMLYQIYREDIVLAKLAVLPEARRTGVGTALLAKLIGKLDVNRRTSVSHWIRESNLDGQCFLREWRFKAVKVHRRFFSNGEDAYEMRYLLEG